jgi:hypothetical protein
MKIINSFLEQYQKEYDYYYELSKIVSDRKAWGRPGDGL